MGRPVFSPWGAHSITLRCPPDIHVWGFGCLSDAYEVLMGYPWQEASVSDGTSGEMQVACITPFMALSYHCHITTMGSRGPL